MVTGGKDRGKTGKVIRTEPEARARSTSRASTSSSATSARARSRTPQKGGEVGGIIEKEGPIHISNVMLLDPADNKPTRVRVERGDDGKRKRVAARKRHGDRLMEAATDRRQPSSRSRRPRRRGCATPTSRS